MHLFLRDDELKLAPIQGKKVYSAQHLNWDISASLNRDRVKPLFKCSPEQGSLAPALSLHKALFLMEAASIQTGIQTLGGVCFISTIFCCSPCGPVGCCTFGDPKGRLPEIFRESHSSLKYWIGGQWQDVGIPCETGGDTLWTSGVMNTFFSWVPAQIIIKWQYWEKLWSNKNILADLKINLIFFVISINIWILTVKLWIKLIYPWKQFHQIHGLIKKSFQTLFSSPIEKFWCILHTWSFLEFSC